jgi:hypothetical protein
MSKYLRVMGLCFSSGIVIALIGLVTTVAWPVSSPAQDDVCDGLKGAVFGLCHAYCEGMDCDSDEPRAPENACGKMLARYIKKTQSVPPCIDTCADLAAEDPCPCDYFRVPFDCWMGDPNRFVACDDPNCTPPGGIDECVLAQRVQQSSVSIEAVSDDLNSQCVVSNLPPVPVCGPEFFVSNLSATQFATCLCDLALYATLAHQAGIPIDPDQEKYSCEPPD